MKTLFIVLLILVTAAMLFGCSSQPQIVYKDRIVTVYKEVSVHVDPRFTQDTVPAFILPATGPLTIQDTWDRLGAVEDSLTQCRKQLTEIRTLK